MGKFCFAWVFMAAVSLMAESLEKHAVDFKEQLAERVMPYWYDTAQDKERGGYLLRDDLLKGRATPSEKQLVTQARMIWGFSHAHTRRLTGPKRNYLQAAQQGYQFLENHFKDKEHGGYFFTTDLKGTRRNDKKIMYGQAFVIYAYVELHRASRNPEPLAKAMELYQLLQKKAHDEKNGGWVEHFSPDWQPILKREAGADVEVPGLKSANTHLHLMEAFTELYAATRSGEVKKSLEEALKINKEYFYPIEPGKSSFHRHADWKEVSDPSSAGLSYGHNVEFAWLIIRAERVLGIEPSWKHFYAHLDHALKNGYDHERGGTYDRGMGDQPADKKDKVWWVQSEMMAALTDAIAQKDNKEYRDALESTIHFLTKHMINEEDGIWVDTVTESGERKSTGKAHSWKANYHDVRALVKFYETFDPRERHKVKFSDR